MRVEEGWTYGRIAEKFGIKSESQIITWVRKSQNGESFRDYGDVRLRSILVVQKKRMLI